MKPFGFLRLNFSRIAVTGRAATRHSCASGEVPCNASARPRAGMHRSVSRSGSGVGNRRGLNPEILIHWRSLPYIQPVSGRLPRRRSPPLTWSAWPGFPSWPKHAGTTGDRLTPCPDSSKAECARRCGGHAVHAVMDVVDPAFSAAHVVRDANRQISREEVYDALSMELSTLPPSRSEPHPVFGINWLGGALGSSTPRLTIIPATPLYWPCACLRREGHAPPPRPRTASSLI